MNPDPVVRDERTIAVENISYRWAYLVLSYGLLGLTAYRGFVRHEQAWDLLVLVVAGGVAANIFQGTHHTLSRRWVKVSAITIIVALALAGALVVLGRSSK